jgi:CheY-like chemotaxis protein
MSAKILVVEDSFETRDSLTVLLELCGYDVIVANNGEEGLVRALREAPDLIVTDVRMPGVNGIAMLRELRKHPGFRPVPAVVVTGYSRDCADEAFAAGADSVVAKPLNPEHLLKLVDHLLKKDTGNTSEVT